MTVCCCSLAGTRACRTCQMNPGYEDHGTYRIGPTKIIEKFDDKGNLIERITEQ